MPLEAEKGIGGGQYDGTFGGETVLHASNLKTSNKPNCMFISAYSISNNANNVIMCCNLILGFQLSLPGSVSGARYGDVHHGVREWTPWSNRKANQGEGQVVACLHVRKYKIRNT
jgi:hypothetical protein